MEPSDRALLAPFHNRAWEDDAEEGGVSRQRDEHLAEIAPAWADAHGGRARPRGSLAQFL